MINARHARTPLRHAKPTSRIRRVLLATVAAVALSAGTATLAMQAADAATLPHYSKGDAQLCADATAWWRAGMPTDRLSAYWLAQDALTANGAYRHWGLRVAADVAAGYHGRHAARQFMIVCHPDW